MVQRLMLSSLDFYFVHIQVVWKSTTKLGCSFKAGCGMKTYVCQYTPAGNMMGSFAKNVGRPV